MDSTVPITSMAYGTVDSIVPIISVAYGLWTILFDYVSMYTQ